MIVEDFYESREPRLYKDYAPALRAEREGLKVVEEAKVLGGQTTELKSNNGTQYYQQDRVYGSDGLAMCEPANLPGGSYKYLVKETEKVDLGDGEIICSKTKDGGAIVNTGKDGVSITVKAQYYKTSLANFARSGASYAATGIVEKNPEYIEVAQATKDGSIKCKVGGCYNSNYPDSKTRRGRVQEDGDVTPTLTVADIEKINYVETKYRIRKLTPKECWRLMGYTDEDFDKASASGVSNTQLYKQAGNAIIRQVLMALFLQMGIQGHKRWNEEHKA